MAARIGEFEPRSASRGALSALDRRGRTASLGIQNASRTAVADGRVDARLPTNFYGFLELRIVNG